MTLDEHITDDTSGNVNEPPPKRQRKPKAKPAAVRASLQRIESEGSKDAAGDSENTTGDQPIGVTENVVHGANVETEST